jgi:hypothetical protein
MLGSNILEVAMGIIFVFILVSTICTAIREGIEARLKTRAAYLEQGIRQLLQDPAGSGLAKSVYNHPLIYGLFNSDYKPGENSGTPKVLAKGDNLPSYIPAKNFAAALLDIAAHADKTDAAAASASSPVVSLDDIRGNIAKIGNEKVQRILLNAIDTAQGDINKAQANVEAWFDSGMDRVSGWYKRSTQWIIFIIAVLMTLLLNINTITITNYLIKNDTARKMLVAEAETAAKDTTKYKDANGGKNYDTAKADLENLKLPIGWAKVESAYITPDQGFGLWNGILGPLLGWAITALAATLGAPFWFDILNKVMVIRSTVKPNEKSGEERSKDNSAPQIVYVAQPAAAPAAGATPPTDHAHDDVDGCDVVATELTADDELPESKGGMI